MYEGRDTDLIGGFGDGCTNKSVLYVGEPFKMKVISAHGFDD